jgi:hypothetical protein
MLKFIANGKKIAKANRSISIFFVWLTALSFGSSFLAPAVNTLVFVYGINIALEWSLFASSMVGAFPQVAYVVLCLLTCFHHTTSPEKKKKQLEVQIWGAKFLCILNIFCMLGVVLGNLILLNFLSLFNITVFFRAFCAGCEIWCRITCCLHFASCSNFHIFWDTPPQLNYPIERGSIPLFSTYIQ